MPNQDSKHQYVRVRPHKSKDKDRDKDTRSIAESSTGSNLTTIRDKKHRGSFTSASGASTETSSQAPGATCEDVALEQLPPLPETEESEGTSAATSPIMRTTSHTSAPKSRTSPPVTFDTPDNLQPYLESEPDTGSTVSAADLGENQEWIGPVMKSASSAGDQSDLLTPTARPRRNPLDPFQEPQAQSRQEKHEESVSVESAGQGDHSRSITEMNDRVFSWANQNGREPQFTYPSHMINPFLHTRQHSPPQEYSNPSKLQPPPQTEDRTIGESKPPAPPTEPQRSSPPEASKPAGEPQPRPSIRPGSKPPMHPLARVEAPPAAPMPPPAWPPQHSPPMTDFGIPPNHPWHPSQQMIPSPMHQPMPPPMHFPIAPPTQHVPDPAHLIHRVGSALPDIVALMDLYYGTYNTLVGRDRCIAEMQAQQAAESEARDLRIERLGSEIETVLKTNDNECKRLKGKILEWEERHQNMAEECSSERRLKEEARALHAKLRVRHDDVKRKHAASLADMNAAFLAEKGSMKEAHDSEKKAWDDHLQEVLSAGKEHLTARLAELEKRHEVQRQELMMAWNATMHEVEKKHGNTIQELQDAIRGRNETVEEEKRTHSQSQRDWDQERNSMLSHWDEERKILRKSLEDERTISTNLRGDNDELHRSLDRIHAHYASEIKDATSRFAMEKEEHRSATEAALARQHRDAQDVIAVLQREKRDLSSSAREASQTRQALQEQRDTARQLQREKDDLASRARGVSQNRQAYADATGNISRLQREVETLKTALAETKPEDDRGKAIPVQKFLGPASKAESSKPSSPSGEEEDVEPYRVVSNPEKTHTQKVASAENAISRSASVKKKERPSSVYSAEKVTLQKPTYLDSTAPRSSALDRRERGSEMLRPNLPSEKTRTQQQDQTLAPTTVYDVPGAWPPASKDPVTEARVVTSTERTRAPNAALTGGGPSSRSSTPAPSERDRSSTRTTKEEKKANRSSGFYGSTGLKSKFWGPSEQQSRGESGPQAEPRKPEARRSEEGSRRQSGIFGK